MKRAAPLLVVLVVALSVPALDGSSPAAPTSCKPGVSKVAGGVARTFCGTAKATVKVNGRSYAFTNGQCDIYPKYLVVNIGTVVVGSAKRKAYFGLLMGKHPAATAADPVVAKDGRYKRGLITANAPGLRISTFNEPSLVIVLTGNRRAGVFSWSKSENKIYNEPALMVAGSFRC
jgi:hypothetical protein